ncbi:DUF952 domain-containing protein [Rhodococcus sp. KBS0724]|uniref:DUF952 domain-containing protein n=1 Tax=Rhodococcus sp. KBS0724 TaxID=1179674 RepID=UPI0021B0B4DF|nr:DUF952 domain-containing protein [Rhodococcus sp. KBS0724]
MESADLRGLTDDLRRGQRAAARDRQQGRRQHGGPGSDLGGEFINLDRQAAKSDTCASTLTKALARSIFAGFIHAATAGDLEYVLATVYGDLRLPLVVVVIDQDALLAAGVSISWDERSPSPPGTGTRVPRILGEIPLDPDIVLDVLPIEEVG